MIRDELIDKLEKSREAFLELVEDIDDAAMVEVLTKDQWSIKDILAHLARWEAELVKLLWQLRQGQRPTTAHFMGDTIDATNARWKVDDEFSTTRAHPDRFSWRSQPNSPPVGSIHRP